MTTEINNYYECVCGSEVLRIAYDSEDPDIVYISLLGRLGHKQGVNKLRSIWKTLITGTPYEDEFILPAEALDTLIDELSYIRDKIEEVST